MYGVAQSVGYGENRAVTPVGGGLPVNKYYFYPIHDRLKMSDASGILRSKGFFSMDQQKACDLFYSTICDCKQCKEIIRNNINNFNRYILRIKNHTSREIQMVEKTVLDRFFDDDEIAFLKDTIIPTPNAQSSYNTAYGIFLGYSIGVKAEEHPEIEYDQLVTKKMTEDIQRHAGYIANKIKSNGLDMHSFYIYILPFMDAETNKSEIMDHVMKGAVVL